VTIRVALAEPREASYDILIGRALLADLPALVKAACPAGRYAVITDAHVAKLYGEKLVARCHDATLQAQLFDFPAGESNKTRETWATLSDRMLAAQFGRDSAVVALGGGVVGDLAGFVAATYLRGIPCIQVPTTLLAMIHQPRLVVADLDVLGSLPPPQLAAGMAEAVKHGVIADRQYFDALDQEHGAVTAREAGALERVVRRSVEIKAEVVAADEREAGRRAILNFGHTVGHAIEATTKFATLHGEAVAIGMAYEARLAEALGIAEPGTADRVHRVLERYNLPLDLPASATVDALVAAMQLDKKARDGTVRFALPQAIGRMYADGKNWTVAASEDVVRDVLGGRAAPV